MNDQLKTKLEGYRRAQRKGVDYILQHRNEDGSIGPVEEGFFYYRTPWALVLSGEPEAGARR